MSLTLEEARARAALLHDVAYDVELDLTDAGEEETFSCRATITFSCRQPGAETFLELTHATELRVDGEKADYDGARIRLRDLRRRQTVVVEARVPYVTDGEGIHTFTDPADGEVYASAYCGMDVTQRIFPCFDQNDLKAPITLRVSAPAHWTVLANGRGTPLGQGRWEFATTPPLPPAMFVMCGGPWASLTWEHAGLPFGWHARASLRPQLERDGAELRRLTEACFDHYAEVFDEPYAFDSYDQAMVPGQNWGAVETPGCITYRDEMLPLGEPTEPERRSRAMVVAHEMAHMWFGDLVTMTWWEDTWLQESFADYLGFRVSAAAGIEDPFVDFTIGWKPSAYAADERRSTHPVAPRAEDVPDLDAATVNFDALSYAKGGSCLRQLVTWLGDDAFFAGVNAYLTEHRWANTTLDDFVAALDSATDRDVRAWAQAWLRTTGFDTITAERAGDEVMLTRTGARSHRIQVAAYDDDLMLLGSGLVDLADEPARLPAAPLVVPNAAGETYARLRLDAASWAVVVEGLSRIRDDATRALLWQTAIDLVWTGELAAAGFLDLLRRHLPGERHTAIVNGVLRWTSLRLLRLFVPASDVSSALAGVAEICATALADARGDDRTRVLTRLLASATSDLDALRTWAADDDPTLRWGAVRRLAALGEVDAATIERQRVADGTVVADLGAATAAAALPDPDAKEAAWMRMMDDAAISNREFEALAGGFWDLERVDLAAPYVDRYLAEAPRLGAARGPAFCDQLGDAFPAVAFTDAQVAALEAALEGDVPGILRRAWSDALDDLRRRSYAGEG